MPTCPGCRDSVPYNRLPVHQRYCPGLWTEGPGVDNQTRAIKQLSRTFQTQERQLEARVENLEQSLAELGAAPEPSSNRDRQ